VANDLHDRRFARLFRKSPQSWAPAVQLGGGQTELLIFLILGWGANKDLIVSLVRVDVVVFSMPLYQVTLSGKSAFNCSCRCGVLAMTALKPAAESSFLSAAD
jgi:hypothetical protein